MSAGDIAFLCMTVGAITIFGAVLAWASWMETREQKRKKSKGSSQADLTAQTNNVGRIPSAQATPKIASRPF